MAEQAVGEIIVVFGARQWRRRASEGGDTDAPGWMRRLDGITAWRAAGLAALFNVAKPKNLLLAVAAGLAVAQVGPGASGGAVAVAVFVLPGSAGIAALLVIHVAMPRRSSPCCRWRSRRSSRVPPSPPSRPELRAPTCAGARGSAGTGQRRGRGTG